MIYGICFALSRAIYKISNNIFCSVFSYQYCLFSSQSMKSRTHWLSLLRRRWLWLTFSLRTGPRSGSRTWPACTPPPSPAPPTSAISPNSSGPRSPTPARHRAPASPAEPGQSTAARAWERTSTTEISSSLGKWRHLDSCCWLIVYCPIILYNWKK